MHLGLATDPPRLDQIPNISIPDPLPETANLNPKLDVQDLWLVHDDTMDRLRADPRFVAASQRVAEATCGL